MSHKGCFQAQGAPFPPVSCQLPLTARMVRFLTVAAICPSSPPSRAPDPGDSALEAGSGDVDMHALAAFQVF